MRKFVVLIFLVGELMAIDSPAPGELSKQMCKKYAAYAPEDCSIPNSNLTLGNFFAARDEFPHMVMLGYRNSSNEEYEWLSVGSLISEDFVLAAAHSFTLSKGKPEVVRIGVTDLKSKDNLQEIKVKEALVHPNYTRSSQYNNIALIKLEKKVDLNRFARPACLFTEKEIGVDKAISTGWGQTEFAGEFNDNLQKVNVEFFDEPSCNKIYKKQGKLSLGITYDNMICAGTKSIITILPQAGGSLIIPHNEEDAKCMYDIIGVSSFGKPGGLAPNIPDVYTRVSAYIPWIEDNVWK